MLSGDRISQITRWLLFRLRRTISQRRLVKVDDSAVPVGPQEIRLFLIAKNESYRLPYFFKYYRELGVDRFFVVDNKSSDNTVEIALSQKNTHVFKTYEGYGVHWLWMQILLDQFGLNHWCVVVDADELFYYANAEKSSIKDLCRHLERTDATAVRCLLLDMYPKDCISRQRIEPGENPLEKYCYFDAEYSVYQTWATNYRSGKRFEMPVFEGGVRKRVFGLGSWLSKVPLFKYSSSTYLSQGMHGIDGATVSSMQGVVFHFKFDHEFVERIEASSTRTGRFSMAEMRGLENDTRVVARIVRSQPDFCLYHDKSHRYIDAAQLSALQILKSNDSWNASDSTA